MRPAHSREQAMGIAYYVSDTAGIGGHLRDRAADFRVREREAFETQPVDADTGAYPALVFRATLTNRDTNGFVNELANRLGISRERITWAGTKDKRAITTQLFSIRNFEDTTLPELSGAAIEVVGRAGRPVLFGDHIGNEFELVVRDVHPDSTEKIDDITADLRSFVEADDRRNRGRDRDRGKDAVSVGDGTVTIGVPNFFGQQRFGTLRPVTHEVGLAIVRGDWEKAVIAYLGNPSEHEPADTREARDYVDRTHDWQGAIDRFPTHLRYERSIAHRLTEIGGDEPDQFREALTAVPSNLQALFVHAAQSYLFNQMLSLRLERDLPFSKPVVGDVVCFVDEHGRPDSDRQQLVTESRVETVVRHCERGRAFVTAPLVGTDTELSEGEQGEIERQVLDETDLSLDAFDLPGEFDSTGTRRPILLQTELSIDHDPLTFSFSLPNGSYATVLMREYLKADPESMA
ncbi:tRNA pseudouridine(13) synthase TruD [Halocatena marina]|uniref:tRNA pseudouridine(13) synthase TruD n=1 Tax=Halocatena marina TaxID=2934937 RepID=UPI00200C3FF2|nr:tRNA pseudouridine(13) synthase TruD [Halocatena marina]